MVCDGPTADWATNCWIFGHSGSASFLGEFDPSGGDGVLDDLSYLWGDGFGELLECALERVDRIDQVDVDVGIPFPNDLRDQDLVRHLCIEVSRRGLDNIGAAPRTDYGL